MSGSLTISKVEHRRGCSQGMNESSRADHQHQRERACLRLLLGVRGGCEFSFL